MWEGVRKRGTSREEGRNAVIGYIKMQVSSEEEWEAEGGRAGCRSVSYIKTPVNSPLGGLIIKETVVIYISTLLFLGQRNICIRGERDPLCPCVAQHFCSAQDLSGRGQATPPPGLATAGTLKNRFFNTLTLIYKWRIQTIFNQLTPTWDLSRRCTFCQSRCEICCQLLIWRSLAPPVIWHEEANTAERKNFSNLWKLPHQSPPWIHTQLLYTVLMPCVCYLPTQGAALILLYKKI